MVKQVDMDALADPIIVYPRRHSTAPRRLLAIVLCVLVVVLATTLAVRPVANPPGFSENFSSYPAGSWEEGSVHGPPGDPGRWYQQFNAGGTVGIQTDGTSRVLVAIPMQAVKPGETHALLTKSGQSYGGFDLTVELETVRQLRTLTPNPWEVAWVLWSFQDQQHFYYFSLKTNGWEVGKEDPAYPGKQNFLRGGLAPANNVGRWQTIRVRKSSSDNTTQIWVNSLLVTTFRDTERPYEEGQIALYAEDAEVRYRRVIVGTPSMPWIMGVWSNTRL